MNSNEFANVTARTDTNNSRQPLETVVCSIVHIVHPLHYYHPDRQIYEESIGTKLYMLSSLLVDIVGADVSRRVDLTSAVFKDLMLFRSLGQYTYTFRTGNHGCFFSMQAVAFDRTACNACWPDPSVRLVTISLQVVH